MDNPFVLPAERGLLNRNQSKTNRMHTQGGKIFVKLYIETRVNGMMAAMSDRDWKTLCVLATYMNQDGQCNPSQARLARDIGVSHTSAWDRVKSLSRFRFNGQPVIDIAEKKRTPSGRFASLNYRILPESGLAIFHFPKEAKTGQ
jgi:hypothetical protein